MGRATNATPKGYPSGLSEPVPQHELRRRTSEVPRDKTLVLVCNTGVRSFEAQIVLSDASVPNTLNLQGGMTAVRKWGLDI